MKAKKATKHIRCKGCDDGLIVMMLDEDGTRTDISKRPGVPSHAVDEYWWPCAKWVSAEAPEPALHIDIRAGLSEEEPNP